MQKKYLQVCGKSEFLNMKYWLAASPLKLYIALKNKLGEGPYRTGWQAPVGQSRDSFGIHGLSLKSQKKKKKKTYQTKRGKGDFRYRTRTSRISVPHMGIIIFKAYHRDNYDLQCLQYTGCYRYLKLSLRSEKVDDP